VSSVPATRLRSWPIAPYGTIVRISVPRSGMPCCVISSDEPVHVPPSCVGLSRSVLTCFSAASVARIVISFLVFLGIRLSVCSPQLVFWRSDLGFRVLK
jgi:hypothetical protein